MATGEGRTGLVGCALGLGLSFLLHLPWSVPLEWDGGSSVEKLTFFAVFSSPSLPPSSHRLQLLEFFIQAVEVGLFFLWGMGCKTWAGLFLPIQSCLLVIFGAV